MAFRGQPVRYSVIMSRGLTGPGAHLIWPAFAVHHRGLPARCSVKTVHRTVFRALTTPIGEGFWLPARPR